MQIYAHHWSSYIILYRYIQSTGPCMHLCLKTKILTCMHAIRSPPAIQPRRVQLYLHHSQRSQYQDFTSMFSFDALIHIRYNWTVLIELFPYSRNTLIHLHVAGICTLQRFQVNGTIALHVSPLECARSNQPKNCRSYYRS